MLRTSRSRAIFAVSLGAAVLFTLFCAGPYFFGWRVGGQVTYGWSAAVMAATSYFLVLLGLGFAALVTLLVSAWIRKGK